MVFFDLWSRQQPALAAKVFPAHLLTIVLTADAKLKNWNLKCPKNITHQKYSFWQVWSGSRQYLRVVPHRILLQVVELEQLEPDNWTPRTCALCAHYAIYQLVGSFQSGDNHLCQFWNIMWEVWSCDSASLPIGWFLMGLVLGSFLHYLTGFPCQTPPVDVASLGW